MAHLCPDLVVCSRVTFMVESRVPAWVELYPNCEAYSRVSIRGETTRVNDMQLTDLLTLLDQISALATPG